MNNTMENPDESCATAMNFTENQQGIAILGKLRMQKNMGRFCDVSFHVRTHTYRAHRNVLAACSPYFDSILSQSGKEDVIVNCNNPQVFGTLLDYIYSGKVVIHLNTVSELLMLANQYMMSKLKSYCCEYLERNIRIDNCYSIRDLAGKCSLPGLCKSAEAFVLANIVEVWQQKEVLGFSKEELDMTIANKSLPVTEQHKLDLICHWLRHDIPRRDRHTAALFGLLQWNCLPVAYTYSLLQDSTLFLKSERCTLHLLEMLELNGQLFDTYRGTLTNLRNKLASEVHQVSYNTLMQQTTPDSSMYTNKLPPVHEAYNATGAVSNDANDDDYESDNESDGGSYGEDSSPVPGGSNLTMSECPFPPVTFPLPGVECMPLPSMLNDKGMNRRKRSKPLKIEMDNIPAGINTTAEASNYEKPAVTKRRRKKVEENTGGKENGSTVEENSQRVNRSGDQLPCSHCSFTANSEEKLEGHVARVHKDNIKLVCNICEWSTKWSRDYNTHMKDHFDGPPYMCDTEGCVYSTERLQLLLYHRRKHSNDRPYQCPICNLKFRSRNNLSAHVRCHTGLKPFVCQVCSRGFATKGTLEQHSVTHSDARPYLCDTCGFSTKYQSHLIAHRRIHTGDVFKCQHPKCKYVTPKRSQLACHMRSHMAIRSHTCTTCGKSFVEKSHLVRHERIHTNDKPHKCDICGYSSTRRDKLKEHMSKHHKPTEEEEKKEDTDSPKTSPTRKKTRKKKTKAAAKPKSDEEDGDPADTETEDVTSKDVARANDGQSGNQITPLPAVPTSAMDSSDSVGLHLPHVPQPPPPTSPTTQSSNNPAVLRLLGSVISQDSYDKDTPSDCSQEPVLPPTSSDINPGPVTNPIDFVFQSPNHSVTSTLDSMQTPPAMLPQAASVCDDSYQPRTDGDQQTAEPAQADSQDLTNLQSIMNAYHGLFPS